MTYIGIIIVFLLGFSILQFINEKFSLLEILGFSYLLGIGATTLVMFLLNVFGTTITKNNLLIFSILLSVGLNYRYILQPKTIRMQIEAIKKDDFFFFGNFSLVWLIFLAAIVFILYGITSKNLYWPTLASDTVSSFDLFAKAIAKEGKILNSLIYDKGVGYGAAYPPLYSLSLAYSYIFGFEISKIIPALFFISFIISFYALLIRNVSSLAAIVVTFLMMISPELLAQSAINTTSVPQAIYGSLGIIAIFSWHQTKQNKYLILAVLLLALNGWIRSEGIVYIGGAFVFYFVVQFQKKEYLKPFVFFILTLIPFIGWQIFLFVNSELMGPFVEVNIHILPNTNYENIKTILYYTKFNFLQNGYYGITVYVFAMAFILNIIGFIKHKENFLKVIVILLTLLAYLYLLNQIESHGASLEAFMRNSAKRFFFGIVILMWFYFVNVGYVKNVFAFLERFIAKPNNKKLND